MVGIFILKWTVSPGESACPIVYPWYSPWSGTITSNVEGCFWQGVVTLQGTLKNNKEHLRCQGLHLTTWQIPAKSRFCLAFQLKTKAARHRHTLTKAVQLLSHVFPTKEDICPGTLDLTISKKSHTGKLNGPKVGWHVLLYALLPLVPQLSLLCLLISRL
jgi:hypothetical protein